MMKKIELALFKHFDDTFYLDNFIAIRTQCAILFKYLHRMYIEGETKKIYNEIMTTLLSKEKDDFLQQVYLTILIEAKLVKIQKDTLWIDVKAINEKIFLR